MKPQVAESVVYIENVVDVWNDLKERYLQAMRNARMFKNEDKIIQFLMGLNEQYQSKKDNRIYGIHAQLESKNDESQGRVYGKGRGYGNNLGVAIIKKHGYPPNWGFGRGHQGNAYANHAGVDNDEGYHDAGNAQLRATYEGNVSLTKDQYNSLIALLERNQVDGTKQACYQYG
ncbi:hypothetical protein L195_g032941 [Trifolium pratense]|uniref:Uncharacterized protein n=1 Tax=Trifolium pratense TaxID=57577 RepID=A0A2K3LEM0_TRIPR|nr:hypothetical protein L195_g032941 [Trifolium pratense]